MILGPNDPFRLFRIVIEVGGTLLQSCPYLKVKTVTLSLNFTGDIKMQVKPKSYLFLLPSCSSLGEEKSMLIFLSLIRWNYTSGWHSCNY